MIQPILATITYKGDTSFSQSNNNTCENAYRNNKPKQKANNLFMFVNTRSI